jgi:aminoglycoside phosphotransferase (APT) family kinase protein
MTASPIDSAAAARLAALDPALSLLPRALAAVDLDHGWRLADVRWTPGEGCRLAYLKPEQGGGAALIGLTVSATEWSRLDYRDDPDLPGIRSAADPSEVMTRLESTDGASARSCRVVPVRYRPGTRCVLRYELEGGGVHGALYGKAFRAPDYSRVSSVVPVLRPRPGTRWLVPQPVAIWPDWCVIVSKAIEGRTVSAALGDVTVPDVAHVRLARRLGELLARFHAQGADEAPWYAADDQLAALASALGAARLADPVLADRLDRLVEALAQCPPSDERPVLGHGSFHAGQVILGSDRRLTILDTDGVSRCGAGRDLGRALAHLTWQAVRQPGRRAALDVVEEAFLAGYERRAGRIEPSALRWWRAAAMILIAARRYSRLEFGSWPLVPLLVDEAERVLAPPARPERASGAVDLLDVDQVSALVRPVLAPAVASPRPIRVVSADRVATRIRRRSTVRYRVIGMTGGRPMTLIGKVFADDHHARRLHTNLRLLSAGPFAASPYLVPRPLGLLSEQRLVLFRACAGTPLDRLQTHARREQGIRRAARWLARLHSSGVVLPRRFALAQEAVSTRRWARRISEADRRLTDQARRLADGWVQAIGTAARHELVPIHKDFQPGHVIIGADTSVIDLDEATQGDPALDLAHFCTYVDLRSIDHPADASLRDAFIEEYVALTRWTDTGAFNAYRAYSWLKIAKQWVDGSGPGQGASRAKRLAGAAQALTRGERCLSE